MQSGCAALEPAPRYCGGAALLTRVAGGPGATRFARCAGRQTGHEGVHSPRQALVCRIRLLSLAALRRRVPGMISGRAPLAQATSISCSSTPVSPGYLRHAAPSRAIYRTSTRYTLLLLRWSPSGGAPTPMVLRSAVALLDTFRGGDVQPGLSPENSSTGGGAAQVDAPRPMGQAPWRVQDQSRAAARRAGRLVAPGSGGAAGSPIFVSQIRGFSGESPKFSPVKTAYRSQRSPCCGYSLHISLRALHPASQSGPRAPQPPHAARLTHYTRPGPASGSNLQ